MDGPTLARLRDRVDVTAVERFDDRVRVEVATDTAGFYRATDLLEEAGVELEAVDTVQPDLEEAFLEITGGGQS